MGVSARPLIILIPNSNLVTLDWLSCQYLQFSCLFELFLLVLRFLAGMGALVDGCCTLIHKITTVIGGSVSVAKARSLEGCSQAVNVISSNRVIPHTTSHQNMGHKPLWGLHQ
jgi:hypothetical protein